MSTARFPTALALSVQLRSMTDADLPFIEGLYASTRAEEVARTGWPPELQRAFLKQQHDAQHRHYRSHYPGAEWLIVERDGELVGRLYLSEGEHALCIVDISLLPTARGQGLGSALLADVLTQATAAGKAVSIHVERNNPAARIYERLGFTPVADKGVYIEMEWKPAL